MVASFSDLVASWSKKQKAASDELISRGSLRHLTHKGQRAFYDFYWNNENIVELGIYTSRKFGKTALLAILGIEECLKNPDTIVKHVLPTLKNSREVLSIVMEEILSIFPSHLRPKEMKSTQSWHFHNGSMYQLGGCHSDSIDSMRGPKCHKFFMDEVAFFDARIYEFAIKSVFAPQQTLVKNPRRCFATTPPESPDHPFLCLTMPNIIAKQAFFKYNIYDNPMLSPERIEQIKEECGGENSNAWRREYMAELIINVDRQITPEFNKSIHTYSGGAFDKCNKAERFEWFIAADLGVTDMTAILLGYYDWIENQLVVVSESTLLGGGAQLFMDEYDMLRNKTAGYLKETDDMRVVIDAFEQLRAVFSKDYGVVFNRPTKRKLTDSVGFLRHHLDRNRIVIHESCEHLINQLALGMWKESTGDIKDFERTPALGHMDSLMSLIYMLRMVRWQSRPGSKDTSITLGIPSNSGKETTNPRLNLFKKLKDK